MPPPGYRIWPIIGPGLGRADASLNGYCPPVMDDYRQLTELGERVWDAPLRGATGPLLTGPELRLCRLALNLTNRGLGLWLGGVYQHTVFGWQQRTTLTPLHALALLGLRHTIERRDPRPGVSSAWGELRLAAGGASPFAGELLRRCRRALGLTQAQLSILVGARPDESRGRYHEARSPEARGRDFVSRWEKSLSVHRSIAHALVAIREHDIKFDDAMSRPGRLVAETAHAHPQHIEGRER
ncbi:MAG: hypothetical protein OXG38_02890 [Chloroflexi bacterium]|nr:hypothetical protein [Chloroflexota bacterium]